MNPEQSHRAGMSGKPGAGMPAPEKAPTVPLDRFRMAERVEYARLSDDDKKVVIRYYNHTPELKAFVKSFKELCEAFGVAGMGPFEPPPDFWPFVDEFRGMKPGRPFHVKKPEPVQEDPLTHQPPKPVKPVILGLEFFTSGSRIEYERLADTERAILGRWMKSCPEGLDIKERIEARVDAQIRETGQAESIGYIHAPFAFWQWLYEERKRMRDAEHAKVTA